MKIAVAKGDGIGPEIMEVVLKIFNAGNVPLQYEFVEMGKMKGIYQMENLNSKQMFEVDIPAFEMIVPFKEN